MSAVKLLPYYTYEDYCNWEGRWELIDGIPFAMSPAPTPRHQWIKVNLMTELKSSIKNAGCRNLYIYPSIDVKMKEHTIVQPDCSLVFKPINKDFLDFPPQIVVEILSPATALKDRYTKFSLYENFGIKYYIIVNEEKEEVEIYCLEDSKYTLQKNDFKTPFIFSLDDDCKIEILIKNIWE